MSFTKITFTRNILEPVSVIQENTIKDNDLSSVLTYLNSLLDIRDYIEAKDPEIVKLWNEIVSDSISSIHSASSGFYRLSMIALRSILETACHSFYFLDHKVEYHLFKNENFKADKYVSALVKDHNFFTTKYIKSFYPNIATQQVSENSVSEYLKRQYSELCDIVHGRYKTLTKIDTLEIQYDKKHYKEFEKRYFETLNIIATMYVLRFNGKENAGIVKLAKASKTVNI